MNEQKRQKDSGKSGLAKSRLFGAIGHVHNPFSLNSKDSQEAEAEKQYRSAQRELKIINLEAEMLKAEAGVMAARLIAHFQKS